MKLLNIKEFSQKNYTIDYENGITCDVTIIDGKLLNYSFKNKWNRLELTNISQVVDIHWSDIKNYDVETINTIDELLSFTRFDELYKIDRGIDGTHRDYMGKPISSLILLDDTFCKIWGKIDTLELATQIKSKCETIDWVKSCDIVKIPYYNRDYYNRDYYKDHTVRLTVKISQEDLDELFIKTGSRYIDDKIKIEILNKIKA